MKCLIIGLGNFGRTLAVELSDNGHDVIGIDKSEHCVDMVKDRISVSYIMDATEGLSLKSLPLNEIDCAIVAIGQSMDSSLRTVAALKELSVKNIYARALDDTHMSILKAMDIKKIYIPESYAAKIYAQKIFDKNAAELL
ncbi:MAG: TrkA family potassium uptake protein [Bacteroidales bacterium]|nr:TrkA family potassium uptake protein [Bacteroidales bacterium]